jgi:hypothetical protein
MPNIFSPSKIVQSQWISIVFYGLSLCFTKISILLLYVNLFSKTWAERCAYAVLAIVVVTNIWQFYVIFSACVPLNAFWDPTVQGATCHSQSYWFANNYLHIATDLLIFILPMPVVWKLQVRMAQKILLLSIFALGFFIVFLSIARITILGPLLSDPGMDFTYNTVPVFYWTFVETNAAIVCACLMTLRPLASKWWPKLVSSQSYSANSRSSGLPNAAYGSHPSRPQLVAGGANGSFGSGNKAIVTSKSWTTTVTSKDGEKSPYEVV